MPSFDFMIGYLDSLSYLGVFFIFLFYFLPIPEEVLLLGIGYLVDIGDLNVYLAVAVSIAGIIAADNMWYWLGRSNSRLLAKLKNKIGKEKLENYEKFLKKHPGKYVFLSRFIPGFRIIGPGVAGSVKFKHIHFWPFNVLAVFIYTPIFIALGYFFNYNLELLVNKIVSVRHIVFILFISLVGLAMVFVVNKNFFRIGFKK
ncbi:MAG: DedA family protein [Patescibacteria group bacterium]